MHDAPRRRRATGPLRSLARAARYHLLIPLFRSAQPPEHTARGVAVGVFWGVMPVLGMQTALILGTWTVMRRTRWNLSLVQALAWQWVNNPVTMVPLYYLFYTTGHLLAGHGWSGGYDAFVDLWTETTSSAPTWTARAIRIAQVLGLPTLIGSLPWAALGAIVSYSWGLRVVNRRRAARNISTETTV